MLAHGSLWRVKVGASDLAREALGNFHCRAMRLMRCWKCLQIWVMPIHSGQIWSPVMLVPSWVARQLCITCLGSHFLACILQLHNTWYEGGGQNSSVSYGDRYFPPVPWGKARSGFQPVTPVITQVVLYLLRRQRGSVLGGPEQSSLPVLAPA